MQGGLACQSLPKGIRILICLTLPKLAKNGQEPKSGICYSFCYR